MKYLTLIITLPFLTVYLVYTLMMDWITDIDFFDSRLYRFDKQLDKYSRWLKK